jgi:5-methylthioadenosine/S-adenosylhomocysteine deaminase
MTYTIQGALIPDGQGYTTVDLQIQADRITAIVPRSNARSDSASDPIGTVIDGRDKLLLPGFVNAHTHSSEMWQRGLIPPLPLELWLAELYDFAPLEPEQIYLSALGTAVETLLTGGTCVVDHLVLIPGREAETIAAAVRAYREVGIRAYVAPLIQDQPFSDSLPNLSSKASTQSSTTQSPALSTQQVLDLVQAAVEEFHHPDAGINIAVAPTGIQLCTDALFEGCAALSDQYGLCRHAHLLESKVQTLLAQEKYGISAVEHLKQLGYLSNRTSLAHCVWLDDYDIAILAATQSTVVHNPLSNLRLGSGIAPILKYRQAGINVAFGCDGSASNDSQDLLEAIKIGSILHNVTDFDYQNWITPRQAVEMAALGGAKGLNAAEQFGCLTVGKKADLVLYDLSNLSLLPRTDPIGQLVLGRPTQAVDSVWVNGQQVVSVGQVNTVDVNQLRQELFNRSQWQATRHSPTREVMEKRYREIMELV